MMGGTASLFCVAGLEGPGGMGIVCALVLSEVRGSVCAQRFPSMGPCKGFTSHWRFCSLHWRKGTHTKLSFYNGCCPLVTGYCREAHSPSSKQPPMIFKMISIIYVARN